MFAITKKYPSSGASSLNVQFFLLNTNFVILQLNHFNIKAINQSHTKAAAFSFSFFKKNKMKIIPHQTKNLAPNYSFSQQGI
jgi:hypothetical protein